MNDEVKEILEELKDNIPIEEYRSEGTSDSLTHYEEDKDSWQYKLYNYITNLQQEKDSFEKIANQNYKVAEDYKSRINNAIAYMRIDKNTRNNCDIYDVNGIEILDILEGKEEDE